MENIALIIRRVCELFRATQSSYEVFVRLEIDIALNMTI